MSAINTHINQQGYYNLGASSGSGAGTQQAGKSSAALAASRALAQTASGGAGGNAAYLLDLSPEAQKYLSGLQQPPAVSQPAVSQDGFALNSQQRLALAQLLDKFKDAPYSQDTFDAIQDELHSSGLGPTQLAAKYRATSFSTTAALVDALNGGNGTTPGSTPVSDADIQSRSEQYMQFIVSEWKKLAGPQDEATDAAPVGDGHAIAAVENGGAA